MGRLAGGKITSDEIGCRANQIGYQKEKEVAGERS